MKEDTTPLKIICDWWDHLEDPAKGNLAFFILVRVKPFDAWISTSEAFSDWVSERLDYFQHLGRTMIVRALIDYTIHEQASPEHLDGVENFHMNMVDDGQYPKEMRKSIGDQLPNLPNSRKAWEDAAESWRVIRDTYLTDKKLRAWEKDMQRQNLGR